MAIMATTKLDVFLLAVLFASYVNLFGESPWAPTAVGKALAKVVAASDARASDGIREIVVVAPRSGHFRVIQLRPTMPCEIYGGCIDPASLAVNNNISVPVCYMDRSDSGIVDVDCGFVKGVTFAMNVFQAAGFIILVLSAAVMVMGAYCVRATLFPVRGCAGDKFEALSMTSADIALPALEEGKLRHCKY